MSPIFSLLFAVAVARSVVNAAQPNCTTAVCYLGYDIKNYLNSSISPCDDFYGHVCSKYSQKRTLGSSFFSDASKLYAEEKRFFLNQPISPDDEESAIKAKSQYKSCMDTKTRHANGLKSIKSVMDELGGWPLLTPNYESRGFQKFWPDIHAEYIEKTGNESSLFNVMVGPHIKAAHAGDKLIFLDVPTGPFGIAPPKSWNDMSRNVYLNFMTNVIKTIGLGPIPQAQVYLDLLDVYYFRQEILRLMKENRGNYVVTIERWQENYDDQAYLLWTGLAQIDWLSMIRASFKDVANVSIQNSTEISVLGRQYLYKFSDLLSRTDPTIIVNHLHLYFLEKHLKYADEQTIRELKELYATLGSYDPDVHQTTERACYDFINMPHAVERLFVKNRIPSGFQSNITEMFDNMKDDLKRQIRESQRVEEWAKEALIKKVDDIDGELGFPSWYTDTARINGFYQNIQIGGDFIKNMLQIEKFNHVQEMSFYSPDFKPIPRPLLSITNAFYDPSMNNILMSLSILRPPFFHILWPDVMKYAIAGFTMAHEISHAFDSTWYKENEKLKIGSWWTQSERDKFERETACFAGQHLADAKKVSPGTKMNPYNFLPENMADAQGLRLAYGAYKSRGRRAEAIPYLENYDTDQIFFLAFAFSHCRAVRSDYMEKFLTAESGGHPYSSFRANGPLMNMREFSRAFRCGRDAPMNPARKCNIWA